MLLLLLLLLLLLVVAMVVAMERHPLASAGQRVSGPGGREKTAGGGAGGIN